MTCILTVVYGHQTSGDHRPGHVTEGLPAVHRGSRGAGVANDDTGSSNENLLAATDRESEH